MRIEIKYMNIFVKAHMNNMVLKKIVNRYMESREDVVNIPQLITYFNEVDRMGFLNDILNEILIQSKIEFNYLEETEND
jgi:hypothetical protein